MAGSGFGAFDINTPSQTLAAAAGAQRQATESSLEMATMPDKIATSALDLADKQKSSMAKTAATDEALIANAAALATDADTWDEKMQTLVDKGVDEARQFIGRFSTRLQHQVSSAYSAASPSAALSGMQSEDPTGAAPQSGLGGAGGGGGAPQNDQSFDQLFAGHTPQQLQDAFGHLEKMRAAISAVAHAKDPAAEWDSQAQAMGLQDQVGKYSPEALQQLAHDTIPVDNYLRGRFLRQGAGVPEAKLPAKIDNVNGTLYAVDLTDPSHPIAKPLTPQGKGTLVGTTKDGKGVYYDPVTGKETTGSVVLSAKPGTNGQKTTVYALKQSAWLQAHPGDTQGALDYAGGLKGKNLSAEQIQVAASMQAAREVADASLAGAQIPDPQAFITERTKQIAADISSAGTGGGPAPAAPGATSIPQRALALLKDGKPHTFNNGTTWQMVDGKPRQVK